MTKKELFTTIADYFETHTVEETFPYEEVIRLMYKEIDHLNRPKSTAPTKKQKENEVFRQKIWEILAGYREAMTVSEIQDIYNQDYEVDYSNQKINSAMIALVKGGRVKKEVVGKKSVFTAITE